MVHIPFFGKKKTEETTAGKGTVPVDRVKELAGKGFSEPEIIDVLRREGYSADESDKAMTQVLKLGVTGQTQAPQQTIAPPEPTGQAEPTQLPTMEQIQKGQPQQTEIPETSLPQEYYQGYSAESNVEYIIEDKMDEVKKKLDESEKKYGVIQNKIDEIHAQLERMEKAKPTDATISTKIDDFDETINDLTVRLGGLEKAFKDTLPTLIESVRALSDLVQKVKKEA